MYHLEIVETFSAAHALRNYPGVCARTHGHNWKIRIGLSCDRLDENGMTADYADLKKIVDALVFEFDHNFFNEHPFFQQNNPTSENIAKYMYDYLQNRFPKTVRLDDVQVWETENFSVRYHP